VQSVTIVILLAFTKPAITLYFVFIVGGLVKDANGMKKLRSIG